MSRVSYVPETYGLEGEDAREAIRRVEWRPILKRSFVRLRLADGFSYARAIAFQGLFTLFPGAIALVAVAVRFDLGSLQRSLQEMARSLAPGSAGDVLQTAFQQGQSAGGDTVALIAGGIAALVAGTTGMSQIQRGTTRIYGIDEDRPTLKRYSLATGLTITVGLLLGVAFVTFSFGGAVTTGIGDGAGIGWLLVVLLVGGLTLVGGIALLFKVAPNRHQPALSWLAAGGAMAAAVWVVLSLLLRLYLSASSSFGDTYGPLAGFIGLALWMQLSGIAILFGMAFAAELEAVRAGVKGPSTDDQPERITRNELFGDS